jgi:hypothetical protein
MAGYADADPENDFSDDDLDHLPLHALAELEHNAIQFTQATQAQLKAPPSSDYGDDFGDEDLDDAVVIDEARSAPAIVPALRRNGLSQTAQREQLRGQRYANPQGVAHQQRPQECLQQPNRDRLPGLVSIPRNGSVAARQGSQSVATDEAVALRKQLEEVLLHRYSTLRALLTRSVDA